MIKATLEYGNFWNEVMDTYVNHPVFRSALEKIWKLDTEDFSDIFRGFALYIGKVFKLIPENGTYKVLGSNGYYRTKNDETTALATAKVGLDGNSVDVTITIKEAKFTEAELEAMLKAKLNEVNMITFINYLQSIGLARFGGVIYYQLEYILERAENRFPMMGRLSKRDRIDLLEDAAETAAGDKSTEAIGTYVIERMMRDGLHKEFRKKVDDNESITYSYKETYYREPGSDNVKFIMYAWHPAKVILGINEVKEAMSVMNLRDLLIAD